MALKKPFFSVIIPTKNRVEPLRLAIESVLWQEFSDWECVIIDNNDDDRAKNLLAEFSDPRLRRVKTGGLHMADNWDAGLLAATGEYVALINDKQCLYGHALLVAHQKLKDGEHELLLWGSDVLDDSDPAHITFGKREGDRKFKMLNSDEVLEELTMAKKSARKKITSFPKKFIVCSHSVVRRSTLETLRRRTGQKICLPVNPDLTMGCHLHNHLTRYLYFDGGMSFFHATSVSTGGNLIKHKKDVNGFWAPMGGEEIGYRHVPIKCITVEGHYYNDYVFMRDLLGGRLARHPLAWTMYYVSTYENFARSHRRGMDRTDEMRAWAKALAAESLGMRLRVKAQVFYHGFKRFRGNLRQGSGLPRLEALFKTHKKRPSPAPKIISSAAGFLEEESRALRALDYS